MPLRDGKVKGPMLSWWLLALMSAICLIAVIIGEVIEAQGLVTTLAMAYLGFHSFREGPRFV